MKVLHVITGLEQGGAQGVLYRLICASAPDVQHVVVSLTGEAYYGPKLRAAGFDVHSLNMPRGRVSLGALFKLRRLMVGARPDVVQTWMYHADLVGGMTARWAGVRAVVWNIRNSNLVPRKSSLSSRVTARICAALSSRVPAAIVCCSEYAATVHQAIGYRAAKFTNIPNGYDLSRFAPDPEARARVRREWGVQPEEAFLGMVARWDRQKDHENLLNALAQLKDRGVSFRCVLVGTAMDSTNVTLGDQIDRVGLSEQVILAGPLDDIAAVMNAIDVHVLSSAYGEAFPNVVAEAMACGTPCVVTDVGDAARIVGATGWVVPPRNAAALSRGIQDALESRNGEAYAMAARDCQARIAERFDLETMASAYIRLWERVC